MHWAQLTYTRECSRTENREGLRMRVQRKVFLLYICDNYKYAMYSCRKGEGGSK